MESQYLIQGFNENEYIYHIQVGKVIYVGQSTAKKPGSRLIYRLLAPFSGKTKIHLDSAVLGQNYDEPELGENIRKYGLKATNVTYFTKDNNFGIPDTLLEAFKETFIPKNGKVISNINAAEILHILYCYANTPYKLLNRGMGGTDGSLSIVDGTNIIQKPLTKFTSPANAYSIFSANTDLLNKIIKIREYFNDIVFTDKWKNFYADWERKNYEFNSGIDKTWAKMTYAELTTKISDDLIDNFTSFDTNKIKKLIKNTVTQWAQNKILIFSSYIADFLKSQNIKMTNPEKDIIKFKLNNIDALIDYVFEAIYNSIASLVKIGLNFKSEKNIPRITVKYKSDWNKYKQQHLTERFKQSKRESFNIINLGTLFDLKHLNRKKASWWKEFEHWKNPEGITNSPAIEELKKTIAFSVFKSFYNIVAKKDYYNILFEQKKQRENNNKDEKPLKRKMMEQRGQWNKETYSYNWSKINFTFFSTPIQQSLSFQIHQLYRKAGINFVENRWTNFYSQLVSIVINKYDDWRRALSGYGNAIDDEIIYREKSFIRDDNDIKLYIGHRFKGSFWRVGMVSSITIY